ncbi:hypothetical protein BJ875DRAFT_118140 [Amylocarpus encephaloides]|uniref:Uncharacterized protein n=1 Tax=Amylocarpus encephaloides TaxID=45428 RepID=A0A9P7YE45_9HELO|nr:hypothetical protein BJ875DRAFT_118140 [Amylocarpus encephaloides]
MCQLTPFTMSCCQHIYVCVKKLPSCPADWPRRKCPADLCIRTHAWKGEEREGECWRCSAKREGLDDDAREARRPVIDHAEVVLGFEEITPLERRAMTQDDGRCWFCCSMGGCQSCGAKKVGSYEPEQTIEPDMVASPKPTSSTKRKRADSAYDVKKSKRRGSRKRKHVEPKEEEEPAHTTPSHFTRSKATEGFPLCSTRIMEPEIDPLLTQSATYGDMAYPGASNFNTGASYPDLPTASSDNWLSPAPRGGASNLQSPFPQGPPSASLHGQPGYNNSPSVHDYDTTPRNRPTNTSSPLPANGIEGTDPGPPWTAANGAKRQRLQARNHPFSPAGYNDYSPPQGADMLQPGMENNRSPSRTTMVSPRRVDGVLPPRMNVFSPLAGHHSQEPAFSLNDFVSDYSMGSFTDQQLFNEQPSAPRPSDPNAASAPRRYLTRQISDFNPFDGLFLLGEEDDSNPPIGHYPPLPGPAHHSNQPYDEPHHGD